MLVITYFFHRYRVFPLLPKPTSCYYSCIVFVEFLDIIKLSSKELIFILFIYIKSIRRVFMINLRAHHCQSASPVRPEKCHHIASHLPKSQSAINNGGWWVVKDLHAASHVGFASLTRGVVLQPTAPILADFKPTNWTTSCGSYVMQNIT